MATLNVSIDSRQAVRGADQVNRALAGMRTDADRTLSAFRTMGDRMRDSFDRLRGAVFSLRGAFAGLGGALAARQILQASIDLQRIENALQVATGSSAAAAREFGFIAEQADRLGLNLRATAGAYAKLSAATLGTNVSLATTREIFLGIAEAGTVLSLSADQQAAALNALQQMISKGTVSAEELRGQLGDVLPGAMNIAAQAMGLTTTEFGKMLAKGEILAGDFIPRFAAQLREQFGGAAVDAANGLQQAMNRLDTAFFNIASSGNVDSLAGSINELAATLNDPQTRAGLQNLIQGFIDLVRWGANAAAAIGDLATSIGESLAAEVHGAAIGDIDRLESQIKRYEELRATLENSPARMMVKMPGLGFQAHLSNEEIDTQLSKLYEYKRISEELLAQGAYELPALVVTAPKPAELAAAAEGVRDIGDAANEADKALQKLAKSESEWMQGIAADAEAVMDRLDPLQARMKEFERDKALLQQGYMMGNMPGLETRADYDQSVNRLEVERNNDLREMAAGADRTGDSMDDLSERSQRSLDAILSATQNWGEEFNETLTQSLMGARINIGELLRAIEADIIRMALRQNVTNPFMDFVNAGINSYFSGGGATFGNSSDLTAGGAGINTSNMGSLAGYAHSGGVIGVDQLPRYHQGLMPDEQLAVLQKGEGVFTKGQMRAMAPAGEAGSPKISIIVNNSAPGAEARAETRQRNDGTFEIEIMIEQMERRMGGNIANGGGMAPMLERTYGLNRGRGAV